MTGSPADILAAARNNPVGPYVPAKDEWLTDWQGPARDGEWNVNVVVLESFGPTCLVYGADPTGQDAEWEIRVSRLRLDTRRPEVRDRLVRQGCPTWARDVPAAVWAWANGVAINGRLGRWRRDGMRGLLDGQAGGGLEYIGDAGARCPEEPEIYGGGWRGWVLYVAGAQRSGIETGDLGRACADLAALRAGCILPEPTGYYVPLADGGIGWWADE